MNDQVQNSVNGQDLYLKLRGRGVGALLRETLGGLLNYGIEENS